MLDHVASADEQQTSGCVQKNSFLIENSDKGGAD